jgi:hypothetical protein
MECAVIPRLWRARRNADLVRVPDHVTVLDLQHLPEAAAGFERADDPIPHCGTSEAVLDAVELVGGGKESQFFVMPNATISKQLVCADRLQTTQRTVAGIAVDEQPGRSWPEVYAGANSLEARWPSCRPLRWPRRSCLEDKERAESATAPPSSSPNNTIAHWQFCSCASAAVAIQDSIATFSYSASSCESR